MCKWPLNHSYDLFLIPDSSPTTYVMEEEEPAFLEPIDYSAESNDEYAEGDNEHGCDNQETTDDHDPLSDSETSHRD